jgi:hypothetical protein
MPESFDHGYALIIGVGDNSYPRLSLPVTVKDGEALRATLIHPGLCAYPNDPQHLRFLHDGNATSASILESLDWLKNKAAGDLQATIVVFYSGHGWLDEKTGKYYLISHDIDPFDLAGSALDARVFTDAIRNLPARRLLVFVDSCHAAGMASSKDQAAFDLPKGFQHAILPKGMIDDLGKGQGRAVFTSSLGTQSSWILKDNSMSIYTFHLIEALKGAGNKPGDTTVRLSNLANHLSQSVPQTAMWECHAEQTPFFSWETEDFPVALLLGGKGLPAGGWEEVKKRKFGPHTSIVASGDRSVAVGGNITGSTIITGDGDTMGNNNIRVGDISNSTGVAIGQGARSMVNIQNASSPEAIASAFAKLYRVVQAMPDGINKQDAEDAVAKLEAEAKKGDRADEQRVTRLFLFLSETGRDAIEVAVATFINPILGISTVFQKVSQKAKEKLEQLPKK